VSLYYTLPPFVLYFADVNIFVNMISIFSIKKNISKLPQQTVSYFETISNQTQPKHGLIHREFQS
jgi:hypothetical protein